MTGSRTRSSIWWSHRARKDLLEIGDFIARDKPEAARRWIDRIMDAVRRLTDFPSSGRAVPEVGRDDLREIILEGYRVVYQIRGDRIIVVTVFEGHMCFSESDADGNSTD